jgi:thiol-disulfide isomerase/thioredoxin
MSRPSSVAIRPLSETDRENWPMKFRALAVITVAGLLAQPIFAGDVVRNSTGQRRVDLDKMELTRFPAEAWAKLTAWTNGEALTAASMDGKPVLIMTWASWHPSSLKTIPIAQNMAAKFGGQGLVVVGVHQAQGWDGAAAAAKSKGLTFPLAHDSAGEFRKALKVGTDPDFYLVDRAGHLRYAAVSSASVEEACAELVGETREKAGDVPRIRSERDAADLAKTRLTSDINKTIDLSTIPPVPPGYLPPMSSDYKNVAWPKVDSELGKAWGLVDEQSNKFKEVKVAFSPTGYFPKKPEVQGRAIVIYLWHPDINETYSKVMPQMDQLQQMYQRDLAVIGAAVPMSNLRPNQSNQPGQEAETAEKARAKYMNFVSSRNFSHVLAGDFAGTALGSLVNAGSGKAFPLPGAMVVSSDGVIRWIGWTSNSDFKYAIETIIAVDPAVQNRRKADRAFIERNK